ncbi:hypothetical protein KY084_06115 [Stakelama sp. CBK3Z-3]|uniref:Uncharacterized protein n=1 Tax=Stakelama flava TaxID=2860338 RepID=A0ABS6XKV9_9SPHN|nr:hypothetical protein [Stakelama flava]MBW4330448.1 hypothetical protein [Stakelama flava]
MSYDQKPARVRVVGSRPAAVPVEANPETAVIDAAPEAISVARKPRPLALILLFLAAAALGGALQAWLLR